MDGLIDLLPPDPIADMLIGKGLSFQKLDKSLALTLQQKKTDTWFSIKSTRLFSSSVSPSEKSKM